MDVSENSGTPKSSILIGFPIINHPFWGIPIFGNTHIYLHTHFFFLGGGGARCWRLQLSLKRRGHQIRWSIRPSQPKPIFEPLLLGGGPRLDPKSWCVSIQFYCPLYILHLLGKQWVPTSSYNIVLQLLSSAMFLDFLPTCKLWQLHPSACASFGNLQWKIYHHKVPDRRKGNW